MEKLTLKDIDFIDKVLLEYEAALLKNKPTMDALMTIAKNMGDVVLGEALQQDGLFRKFSSSFEEATIHQPEQIKRLRAKLLMMRDEILTSVAS